MISDALPQRERGRRSLRGTGTLAAMASLIGRVGLLRHPLAGSRALLRFGGTLPGVIEIGACKRPDGIALVDADGSISYAALRSSVRKLARVLADTYAAGSRIGVRSDGSIRTVVLLAAAVAAGLDVIPLGPRLGAADLEAVAAIEALDDVLDPVPVLAPVLLAQGMGARMPRGRPVGRLILLSSGTSGLPRSTSRGRLPLRALVPLADLDRRIRWPRGPVLVLAPIDHGHGLSAVIAGLLRAETVLLAGGASAAAVTALVSALQPAAATGVPVQLARAADAGQLDGVVRIVSGSSQLDDEVAARLVRLTGASVIDCLGATETGSFALREVPGAFRPLAAVTVRVDAEDRLWVRTPLATGETWTGDSTAIEGAGLRLLGRSDELVDSAGELVSPDHVHRTISGVHTVHSCEVEVIDDELRGAILVARVVVNDPQAAAPGALRETLLPLLGRSAMPRRLDVTLVEA